MQRHTFILTYIHMMEMALQMKEHFSALKCKMQPLLEHEIKSNW